MDNTEVVQAEAEIDSVARSRAAAAAAANVESRRMHTRKTSHGKTTSASNQDRGKANREHNRAEDAPLLGEDQLGDNTDVEDSDNDSDHAPEPLEDEYSHLRGIPWHKRPSVNWILGPFLFLTIAFGGVMVPELSLLLSLICREYISDQSASDPTFTMAPVIFGQENPQCRIPEVQARVATFSLTMSLVGGILSAITSPKIGALSDRYGRKKLMFLGTGGVLANLILFLTAASYPETFPVRVLWVGSAVDGLCGSFIAAMALANSYASDCTPPAQRNIAFGRMHACLFAGIGFGPMLAAFLIDRTGTILSVFYFALAAQLSYLLFLAFVIPESLSKTRQMAAREKYARERMAAGDTGGWFSRMRSVNLFEPLKILYPTGPGSSPTLRRNLIALAAVDTILFGVAMGSITVVLIYTNYAFGWETIEQSLFKSVTSICRVIALIVVLPLIVRAVRGKAEQQLRSYRGGADRLDLTLIRTAVALDTLGYVGFCLSKTGIMFTISACITSFGGIGSPTLQSALTKHVPSEKTGQLLGAIGLLHALARVVAPTIFNGIYALTVGKVTQAVFVCLAATFGLAFVASWFVRPGVFLHDPQSEPAEPDLTDPDDLL